MIKIPLILSVFLMYRDFRSDPKIFLLFLFLYWDFSDILIIIFGKQNPFHLIWIYFIKKFWVISRLLRRAISSAFGFSYFSWFQSPLNWDDNKSVLLDFPFWYFVFTKFYSRIFQLDFFVHNRSSQAEGSQRLLIRDLWSLIRHLLFLTRNLLSLIRNLIFLIRKLTFLIRNLWPLNWNLNFLIWILRPLIR